MLSPDTIKSIKEEAEQFGRTNADVVYGYQSAATLYASQVEELKKENEMVIKMAENLSEIVYQYIQWVTHNTEKQPDFQKCHDVKNAFNDYQKSKQPLITQYK